MTQSKKSSKKNLKIKNRMMQISDLDVRGAETGSKKANRSTLSGTKKESAEIV